MCVREGEEAKKVLQLCDLCVCALPPPLLYVREAEDHCESDLIRLVEGERDRGGERVRECNSTPFQLPKGQEMGTRRIGGS